MAVNVKQGTTGNGTGSWEDFVQNKLSKNIPAEEQSVQEEVIEEVQEEPVAQDEVEEVAEEPTEEVVGEAVEEVEVAAVEEAPEEPAESEEDIFSSWDDEPQGEVEEEKPVDNSSLSNIAKGLGYDEEFESTEQLINRIREDKESQNQEDALAGIPEELIKAVEFAKQGGDYMAYLGGNNVDLDQVADIDLVASAYQDVFIEEGKVNEEALHEHINSMSDAQIKIEARRIRNDYNARQSSAQERKAYDNEQKRLKLMSDVKRHLDGVKDVDEFVVNDYQKSRFTSLVDKDQLYQDLFYTNGKFDVSKAWDTWFRSKNSKKIISTLKGRKVNEGKREILNRMSNPEKPVMSSPPSSEEKLDTPKKVQSNWMKELKNQGLADYKRRQERFQN